LQSQQSRSMDDPQDNDLSIDHFKDRSIIAKKQMTIASVQEFIFRNERTTFRILFQRSNLFFKLKDKRGCGVRVVLGNVIP